MRLACLILHVVYIRVSVIFCIVHPPYAYVNVHEKMAQPAQNSELLIFIKLDSFLFTSDFDIILLLGQCIETLRVAKRMADGLRHFENGMSTNFTGFPI